MKKILSLAFILAFLSIAVSSDAAVRWNKYTYFNNIGGLNDNLSSTEIADNEATTIQNIVFDTGGSLKKRFGYTTVPINPLKVATGTTVCVNGITFAKFNDGTRYLVALANNDSKATLMEKAYGTGGPITGAWVNIDNAGLYGTYTNNFQPSFAMAENNLVFSDGSGFTVPYKWSGTGKSQVLTTNVNCPTSSIVVYYKNQLFLSGNLTDPSRVYFSNLDDITTWDALDFFDVQTADGTRVRAMISAFDSLYIFKDKSIWRLAGTNKDDFTLQKMVEGIGTLSPNSVQVVNNMIYFTTAQNDVAVYDGGFTVQFISQKIRGTIGSLNFTRATNTRGLAFSTYKYVDYDYYVSVSTSGQNDKVLMFDTAYKAWTNFSGMAANCWTVGDNDSGQNAIYFGDYSGYVHRYPSTGYYDGNVATSAINAYYQTKWFKYSEVSLGDKYWRLLKTYMLNDDNTLLTVEMKSDFEASGKTVILDLSPASSLWDVAMIWDASLWGGNSIFIGRTEVEKGTNLFQLRYSNAYVNQGFTIVGFETFIEPTDRI